MFWENIKILLKSKKITQKQLSTMLELPERTVETWVLRNTIPDAIMSVKIAKILDTSVEYLVTGEEPAIDKKKIIAEYLTEQLSELV